ncbi:MAG TPA: hypothetical protein VN513_07665 [Gemmatimonadales bacterium]|nr:hypothetical protein [Gemmatimonadales bacterium]
MDRDSKRRLLRGAALLLGLFLSCDSPSGPQGEGERVPIGQVIEDQITDSVDRHYSFESVPDGEYVVFLKSFEGFVVLTVEDSIRVRSLCAAAVASSPAPLEQNPTPSCQTPAGGVQLITVRSLAGRTARYQFKIFEVHRPPESADSRFTLGDTVTGEAIDPLVDADVFYTHGDSGQTIAAIVEPLGGIAAGALIMYVENPDSLMWLGYARDEGSKPLFTSGPLRLPKTQDYRFVVRGEATFDRARHLGPYRFWSYIVRPEPEHLSSAIVPNVELVGERIDYPNDVDEFTFQDTVGAEFNAFVESDRHFVIQVLAPGATEPMKGRVDADDDTTLFNHGLGPFQLTSTGTYKIQVKAPTGLPWAVADTGAYRFMLYRINYAPENAAVTVAVNDTISTESISPPGDVDEFMLVGNPGDHLVVWFRLRANPVPYGFYMALEVTDSTGALLGRAMAEQVREYVPGITATVTIPTSGFLRIRVSQFPGADVSSAPYEFYIANAP